MRDFVLYPSWGPAESLLLPARSYFYNLQPFEVGTAFVESLTSYVTRLAEAHDVTAGILLSRELIPRVREAFRRHAYRNSEWDSTFLYRSYTLNGGGQCAHDWVRVLGHLTGVQSLLSLTMGTWSPVISGQGLIRTYRAWCSSCYEDWRDSAHPIYEPLLWSIRAVSICTIHEVLLNDHCPHCNRQLQISAKCHPGHCSSCRRWLGIKNVSPDVPGETRSTLIRTANGVGELLSEAANLTHTPSRETFLSNIRFCIEYLAEGCRRRFSIATGVSCDSLTDWFVPKRLVRLDLLCRLCAVVGISPLQFIKKRLEVDNFNCEQARQAIRQRTAYMRHQRNISQLRPILEAAANSGTMSLDRLAADLGYSTGHSLHRRDPDLCDRIANNYRTAHPKRWVPPFQTSYPTDDVIREALTTALLQRIPPRLKAIATELGFRSSESLYRRFPDLCKAFAKHNALSRQQYIDTSRASIVAALTETPPPTLDEVARRTNSTVYALQHRYPDLYPKLVQRLPERRAFLTEQRRAIIQLATTEEPAPSMKSVAARVGRRASYLRRLYPEFMNQIRIRHDSLKNKLAAKRREDFQAEIRAAVIDLSQHGIFPTRRRVFASIENPSMKGGKTLDRQIATTLLELKVASGASFLEGCNEKRFRAVGNHPLAAQNWNHDLAETAIGWVK